MKTMSLMVAIQGVSICLTLTNPSVSFAQSSTPPSLTNTAVPVVTIRATDPVATWSGNPGVFTVLRSGNPIPALNVYCQIAGSASNGKDYGMISSFVQIPSGVLSADVVIRPINGGQTTTETVVLTLTNSPLMGPLTPVNYAIGRPSSATVYIGPGPVTNMPPAVSIAAPPNGAVFFTPANIPIVAAAKDLDGFVTSVEFFADNRSLGVVTNPVTILPPMLTPVAALPPMPPFRPFVLVWSNAPVGPHVLTAKATDNSGASTLSDRVNIAVNPLPPPPPTNFPPVVRITSPPNNSVFRSPLNLPIYAYAADRNGYVTRVEFFAGTNDLGPGTASSRPPIRAHFRSLRPFVSPISGCWSGPTPRRAPIRLQQSRPTTAVPPLSRTPSTSPSSSHCHRRPLPTSSALSRPSPSPSKAPTVGRGLAWLLAPPPGITGPPRSPFAVTSPTAVPGTPFSPSAASAAPTVT